MHNKFFQTSKLLAFKLQAFGRIKPEQRCQLGISLNNKATCNTKGSGRGGFEAPIAYR